MFSIICIDKIQSSFFLFLLCANTQSKKRLRGIPILFIEHFVGVTPEVAEWQDAVLGGILGPNLP